ncbi:hypothetical protein HRbin16_02870 [bacterium HR16]|nr:hypothetical protein HRbin16_02870 [bacterium HR16]
MRLHEGRDEKKINEATMSISERFLYEAIRGPEISSALWLTIGGCTDYTVTAIER